MSLVGKWMRLVGLDWGADMHECWLKISNDTWRGLECRIPSPSWKNPAAEVVVQVDRSLLDVGKLIVSDLACRCDICGWICNRCQTKPSSSNEHTSEWHICQGARP